MSNDEPIKKPAFRLIQIIIPAFPVPCFVDGYLLRRRRAQRGIRIEIKETATDDDDD
jgi:hypothetical protein